MKTSTRILCTLMLVVFTLANLVVMPVSAATFSDVTTGTEVYRAVNVLNKLGVINGYDDGTFKPDNNVTRAEFTAMLLRTRGMGAVGSTSLDNPPFPDVVTPDVSWAIGNIRTAHGMGIINGYDDGTFKPSNNVSYEEAIKMIVCALGYGEMGSEGAAWYSKYLNTAIQLGFTEGANGTIGAPATRAMIAQMLYNCLEVELAENNEVTDKTILENDLKLKKQIGYISSNPTISLSTPDVNIREDEVEITTGDGTEIYKVENAAEYNDMLGAQITFYSATDRNAGTKTLVMATVEKSVTVELEADMIDADRSDENTVVYYESDSAKRSSQVSIASDSIVIYNEQLYGSNAANSTYAQYCTEMGANAIPTLGSMKFLDRNGDKKFDIVFVNSYDAYIVSSTTTSTSTFTDNNLRKGLSNNKVTLDVTDTSKNVKIVDKNGKDVSFSSIRTGSVVCVKSSNTLNGGIPVITAVVLNDAVIGSVKGTNSDGSIKIEGKNYKYSAQAPWVNPVAGADVSGMPEPEMGESGKFYLDLYGDIIGYDKTEQASNQQYGYIMQINRKTTGFDDTLVINILTESGSKASYYAYEKTKINGEDFADFDALLDALDDTAYASGDGNYPGTVENAEYSQLIKFTTKTNNGRNVIDNIITAEIATSGNNITSEDLYFYGVSGFTAGDALSYMSTNKQLTDGSKKINISSAKIFSIPEDRGATKEYKKITTNDFDITENYNVELYDVTGTNSAKIVLVYGGASSAGIVKADSPVMIITGISQEEDPAGELASRYKIEGYVGNSAVSYWGSEESVSVFDTLREGDIVRLGTDSDGYYTIQPEHIVFSVVSGYRDTAIAVEDDYGNDDEYPKRYRNANGNNCFVSIWGSAYQRDNELFVVSTDVLAGTEEENAVDATRIDMQRKWFNGTKVYEFDTTGSSLEITEYGTDDVVGVIDSLQLYDGSAKPAEVFIHMTSDDHVSSMIIIKR